MVLDKWLRLDGDKATWGVLELAITNANHEDLGLPAILASKIILCDEIKTL